MPEDAILQINPYSTKDGTAEILYSISTEWESSDKVKWQLRIHSTDIEHYKNSKNKNENTDWILRIAHQKGESPASHMLSYFIEKDGEFVDEGEYLGEESHIQIPQKSIKDDNLLSNLHFQKIIREISSQICKDEKIKKEASTIEEEENIINEYSFDIEKFITKRIPINSLRQRHDLPEIGAKIII